MGNTRQRPETRPEFIRRQYAFAAHIRDPQANPGPGDVEDRRMAIYRELFYNNVEGFLSSGFPVLRSLCDDSDWHRMAKDFFANHKSHTPYFLEISQEFLRYLKEERKPQPEDPPFIEELAHYEWVELGLSVAEDEADLDAIDPNGDLLDGRPVLSPVACLLSYTFPVHRISTEFRPEAPGEQPTYLLVYRDRKDEVGFMELNPVTARLIELMGDEESGTGREMLETITTEMQHPNPEVVVRGGAQTMEELRGLGVLLGTENR
ncbi:MAG: putative DNA-binding domain-containing protein [Pseudomonadota bacterium]|nr:putative DNA-binding domain-containing protein [Pseudomonadota bacterium]